MIIAIPVIMVVITHSMRLDKPIDDAANLSEAIKRIIAVEMEQIIKMYR